MRISSVVSGLDSLVGGRLPAGRLYVLSGPPGSGKTTLSTQFLVETALEVEATARTGVPTDRPELLSGPEEAGPAAGAPDSLDLSLFLRR